MQVHRITLDNTVFEGKNNAYLIDGDETVLVDVGVGTPETRSQLERGLAAHDLEFADVDRVLLTHWHQDHCGLAGEIQRAGGASVHVHTDDAPLVHVDPDARKALDESHSAYLNEWGMPDEKQEELLPFLDGTELQTAVETLDLLRDGDIITMNGCELEVIHAPGHAAGQCCFAFYGERGHEVFTGDAVLPVYTPNVGGADVRVEQPLTQYIKTLDDLAARNFDYAWPGHRDPIENPIDRIKDIRHHHEERAWNVLNALRDLGPADAWTVSARLFGDLQGIHVLHGPGEAYAHLNHLEANGDVTRTEEGYQLTSDTEKRMEAREQELIEEKTNKKNTVEDKPFWPL